jgi:lipopolysaccharide/colanic/teichoic acid biosynthesis glycosyltransferase
MLPSFYRNWGKRIFDLCVSGTGVLVLSPLLLVLAIGVKLSSPGPILFRQERVGRGGRRFLIAKFRSMYLAADEHGPAITTKGDSRITRFGRVLRLLKLDELPQIWNVLIGDMSFVGPRPEVPAYVDSSSTLQQTVLSVRPGITDPASIVYRYEEELLGAQPDPDAYYRTVVLPAKLRLSVTYIDNISPLGDVAILLKTALCIVMPNTR